MDPYRKKGEERRAEIRERDKKNFKEAMTRGGGGGGATGCATLILALTVTVGIITASKFYFF